MRRAEFHLFAKPLAGGKLRVSVSAPTPDGSLLCFGKLEMTEGAFGKLRDLVEAGAEQLGRRVVVSGPRGDSRFRIPILDERSARR